MIESVEGANWENFPYFQMDFSPKVNVLIGKSHQGKSSLVRAIRWILQNRPQGTSYFPHRLKNPNTEVSLSFAEGFINRFRNLTKNEYEVSGIEEPFSALRTGVPGQVIEISNMTDINIQAQKDVQFFLSDSWTAGKRAKFLNEIVKLEEMDVAMEFINSEVNSIQSTFDTKTKELESEISKFEGLEWVPRASKDFSNIIKLEKELTKMEDTVSIINSVLNEIAVLDNQIKNLPDVSALPYIQEILDLDDSIYLKEKKANELSKLLGELRDLKNQENSITLPDPSYISKFEAITAKIQGNKKAVKELDLLLQNIASLKDMEEKAQKIVIGKQSKFNTALQEMGTCPLCGRSE